MNYNIMADLHTHTIASVHAYSTVKENVDAAKSRGLKYLAVTDHFFNDGTDINKKNEIARIIHLNTTVYGSGIRVIPGLEANLGQPLPEKVKAAPWRPVGFHGWFVDREGATIDDVYDYFVESHERGDCTAFAHIERELHKIGKGKYLDDGMNADLLCLMESLVKYANNNIIPLELNESSLRSNEGDGVERVKFWLGQARELEAVIYLGTDAHYCDRVGEFTYAAELLKEVNYPEELIVNCNQEILDSLFGHLN